MGGWWILCWYTTVLFEKLLIGKIHSQCSQRSCDNNRQNCYGQHQCSGREAPGPGHGTDGSLNRGLRQISMMQNRRSFKFKAVPNRQNMVPRERNTRLQQSWPVPEVRFKRIADIYSGSNQNKKNNLCRDPQFSKFFRKTG